ncbi:cytidine deaminase [Sulfurospirillum sp. T05]|uniref:Cytidine deaminase n=1 Tax=Sulfurospirillum tamanense TaxID=2813362 RepID=A0ABS2WUS3_9BACT|nr:cytidine deaminase [Sulfurospirillum tamanensis]MBN2965404.1 cytidine deaminase [Sulfurospirillum tamanensis]
MESYETLLKKAHEAKENAYAPYSGYKVGAAVLLRDGAVVLGCNVENTAQSATICAERTALFNATSLGYKPTDVVAIAVASSGKNFSPCGPCRQVISEFGADIEVIFEWDGAVVVAPLKTLLPYAFTLQR